MFKPSSPCCQSCGMPLSKDLKYGGTEKNGDKSSKYCCYCYQHGQFTEPDITLDQMVAKVKTKLKEFYIPGFLTGFFTKNIHKLDRWKQCEK